MAVLPVVDLAYQGLGEGMEEDAYGARAVLAAVPEALVAYSCDKNFGLYRDRVGALYVLAKDAGELDRDPLERPRAGPRRTGRCRPITAPPRCGWCSRIRS